MRSAAYPSYTIQECIEIVNKIYDSYGDAQYVDRPQIAKALELSEGAILKRVSSCSQYGLLDMQVKVGYKPTELYKSISRPISEEEKTTSLIEAIKSPPLYQKIINRYEGHHFPKGSAFANILYREFSISSKVSTVAADVFFENAKALELIDSNNILVFSNDISEVEHSDIEEPIENNTPLSNKTNQQPDSQLVKDHDKKKNESTLIDEKQGFHKIEIPLTNKKKAIIAIPININSRDINIIKKQMEVFELYIETEGDN